MNETLRKKYIPMTETTYYTLLAVKTPRHGYAIMQYVNALTEGRITLGTGTLYTMVGRLTADGVIEVFPAVGRPRALRTSLRTGGKSWQGGYLWYRTRSMWTRQSDNFPGRGHGNMLYRRQKAKTGGFG